MQPVCLDLFCGGGGAGEGYRRSGFSVLGVDLEDHARSFGKAGQFHQMDWQDGLEKFAAAADFIHASPPCERYSQLTKWGRKANVEKHPDLIPPVREALDGVGKPYIIENVEGSPLRDPTMLCAWTFGFEHYRHRLFEAGGGLGITAPPHRKHGRRSSSPGHFHEHAHEGWFISVGGHFAPAALAREVMDINWMTGPELAESIPPYYTHYLGLQVMQHLLLGAREPGPEAKRLIWRTP
jgi:DNA (cytosine-5)-methyltransferase 1